MKKVVITLGLVAVSLFANEHAAAMEHVSISDTDFIPRVINFVIFAGILWYLLADKVKTFYADRSKSIADAFDEVENKLRESKAQKEALKAQVEEAHKKADDIINTAKQEVEIIKNKILENAKNEIEMLNKQFNDQKAYEESKMKQEVVEAYLNNLVKDIHLSSEEVANIVTKKVG
jgi:F-type H+-transporting ATPase subunit b